MITKLTIENHGPINNELNISFVLDKRIKNVPSNLVGIDRYSTITGIFGKNGAGKTSIIDAVEIVKWIIEEGDIRALRFRHASTNPSKRLIQWKNMFSEKAETKISLELVSDTAKFYYEIHFGWNYIKYETLKCKDSNSKRWKLLLEREMDLASDSVKKRPSTYSIILENLESKNKIEGIDYERIKKFLNIISKISILKPRKRFYNSELRISKLLSDLQRQVKLGKVKGFTDFKDYKRNIIDKLFSSIDAGIAKIDLISKKVERITPDGEDIRIIKKNLLVPRLKNDDTEYEINHSIKLSLGTYNFITLALAALRTVNDGGVLLVDEFGSQIHPEITNIIIDLFTYKSLSNNSQLIFNSNQLSLIENMHRSQLMFVDNIEGHGTAIRKVLRKDAYNRSVMRNFAKGTYFGAPNVDLESLASIFGDD